MKISKNYTIVPNEMLDSSQLSIQARYLYCVLLRHCGQDDSCFPSQKTLGKETNLTARQVRNILGQLIKEGVVVKKRTGWNRANTYTLTQSFEVERKGISYHLGSKFPLHQGNVFPPKSTYLKGKGKNSKKGLRNLRETMIKKGLFT